MPLIVRWARTEEEDILRYGQPLPTHLVAVARRMGIRKPEEVRLLKVAQILPPPQVLLRWASTYFGFPSSSTIGLTLRYGIFVRQEYWESDALIIHELAHTLQYERFGGLRPFLMQYLTECLTVGYSSSPLEIEAVEMEVKFREP